LKPSSKQKIAYLRIFTVHHGLDFPASSTRLRNARALSLHSSGALATSSRKLDEERPKAAARRGPPPAPNGLASTTHSSKSACMRTYFYAICFWREPHKSVVSNTSRQQQTHADHHQSLFRISWLHTIPQRILPTTLAAPYHFDSRDEAVAHGPRSGNLTTQYTVPVLSNDQ